MKIVLCFLALLVLCAPQVSGQLFEIFLVKSNLKQLIIIQNFIGIFFNVCNYIVLFAKLKF